VAADGRLNGRRRAGEGDVDQVELLRQTKQLAAEMWRRTYAGAGIAVFAGMIPDQCTSSGSVLAGTDGLTTTTFGETETKVTAEKSLTGSYGTLA
jgi:hypothetical protein